MDVHDLAPYTSLLVARLRSSAQRATIVGEILDDFVRDLGFDEDDSHRTLTDRLEAHMQAGLDCGAIHYVKTQVPAWLANRDSEIKDELNHLALVCRRDMHVAIFLSEASAKPVIGNSLSGDSDKGLAGIEPIAPARLNAAFVLGPKRTLWLSGIHRRTAIKADSKILAGSSLEFALDPLDDQSYFFTAVRCTPKLPNGAGDTPIGVSPRRSRLWAGPTRSWQQFRELASAILGQLKATEASKAAVTSPLPVLAAPVDSREGVTGPYDVNIVPPELLAEERDVDPDSQTIAERWAYGSSFEVLGTDGGLGFTARVSLGGAPVCDLAFAIDAGRKDRQIVLEPAVVEGSANGTDPGTVQQALSVCSKPDWLKVRYGSGHTLTCGVLYAMRYRDVKFQGWRFADLTGFDVKKEKPGVGAAFDVDAIGADGEKSLFSWTQRNWPLPLESDAAQRGWLASDDGAGEIADFIHFDFDRGPGSKPLLTLIHVKASGNDKPQRGISTSDYEVVVGQAVKNLRSLDRTNLAERLAAGANKKVAGAVWLDGKKHDDRSGFIEQLSKTTVDFDRRIVVFQPRVTEEKYNEARAAQASGATSEVVARLQQLDTLLVGAEADCRDLGAEFFVIGAGQAS